MSVLLLLAGLLSVLAGVFTLAFCYLNPELRHFDGLLAAASVGFVGGLALVGLGAVAGVLKRITDILEAQPASHLLMSVGEGPAMSSGQPEPFSPPLDAPGERIAAIPELSALAAPEPRIEPMEGHAAEIMVAPAPATPATPEWPSVDASDRIGTQGDGTSPEPVETAAANGNGTIFSSTESELRVLKSGVIEGMAYTLYSDGSVDAELSDGLKHFASISEWRTHLRESA